MASALMSPPLVRDGIKGFEEFCGRLLLENRRPMALYPEERKMLADYFDGVRETLILISKKNGKSSLLAALGLHRLLLQDDANIAIAAASRDQAMVLFDQMRGLVQRTGWLHEHLHVLRGYREIRRGVSSKNFTGIVKVFAADADTADGWLGDLAMVDELHRQRSSALYGVFRDGLGPRNGQMITISTAGDTEDSPLGKMRTAAYEMPSFTRKGTYRYARNESLAMHEWALDSEQFGEMDWPPSKADLRLVKSANPAPWQTPELLSQRAQSPSMTREQWARFACGVWGLGTAPAFDRQRWEGLESEGAIPARSLITLGFDGARRKDATALVACEIETGRLQLLGLWERPSTALDDWEAPEGEVRETVANAFETYDVWRMYADPPYWEYTVDWWAGEYGNERVVAWWTNRLKPMAYACRAFRNDMDPDRMSHDGDADLARHIANAVRHDTRMRDGDEMLWVIRKDGRSSPRKIDAAMAAILAWQARSDCIVSGALNEPEYGYAAW